MHRLEPPELPLPHPLLFLVHPEDDLLVVLHGLAEVGQLGVSVPKSRLQFRHTRVRRRRGEVQEAAAAAALVHQPAVRRLVPTQQINGIALVIVMVPRQSSAYCYGMVLGHLELRTGSGRGRKPLGGMFVYQVPIILVRLVL